jgi:predicted enzyme related to lactoylglutathione lyase
VAFGCVVPNADRARGALCSGGEVAVFKKVAFTMYPVKDGMRARAFYEGTLGLTVGSHSSNGTWTEYDLPGGGCLALFATNEIAPSDTAGGTIALEVEDLDALIADLKGKGVTFKAQMIHSPVCRMSIILDSEGNSVLLHELKQTATDAAAAG